jgi:hypothetical protein
MTVYRIETFCVFTGERQHVEELTDPMEVLIYCTEPWRAQSVHMAYRVTPKGSELFRAYVGGRLITPHLK